MKKMFYSMTVILFLVAACAPTGEAPPAEAPAAATPEPKPTNTPVPPEPTDIPTQTPTPGPEIIFEDGFEGEVLGDGWVFIREEPQRWSLTDMPGYMQILMQPYGFGSGNPHNLLVRDAPDGKFMIETHLVFEPRSNYQIAAIVIYQDDGNVLQLGRAYCDNPTNCVGNGIYFDNFIDYGFTGDNHAFSVNNPGEIYLRLERDGQNFKGYYSEDGEEWFEIATHNNPLSVDKVGFMAGQSYEPAVFANFDYFRIYELP